MRGFEKWAAATQHKFDPDEDLWKAIQYLTNHRKPFDNACLMVGSR